MEDTTAPDFSEIVQQLEPKPFTAEITIPISFSNESEALREVQVLITKINEKYGINAQVKGVYSNKSDFDRCRQLLASIERDNERLRKILIG